MNLLFANDRAGQYPPSYYAETATPLPLQASLRGAVQADVCIIGGGYTGLSAALHLAQRGYSVRLLEAHRVGFGASGRNGGQIGPGQRIEQDAIERMVGHEDARALWQMGLDARDLVHELIAHHGIDSPISPGVIHADWQASGARHSHAYAEKLARDYGYTDIEPLDAAQIQQIRAVPAYQGAILAMRAAQFAPVALLRLGLARAALAAGAPDPLKTLF